jgi:excisionase family DNA binding protein
MTEAERLARATSLEDARDDRLLTIAECAMRWNVGAKTVRKWIRLGLFPAVRLGRRPLIRIALSTIAQVERENKVQRVTRPRSF